MTEEKIKGTDVGWALEPSKNYSELIDHGVAACVKNVQSWIYILFKLDESKTLAELEDEIKQAFEGFDAYAGTYEFDEVTGTVTHYATVARFPNWERTAQVRYAKLVAGILHLSTPPIKSSSTA